MAIAFSSWPPAGRSGCPPTPLLEPPRSEDPEPDLAASQPSGLTNRRMRTRMSGGVRGGGATPAPYSISYTGGFGSGSAPDQLRAFRMSLREKPTVSQTAPLRLTTSSYPCAVQAAGGRNAATRVHLPNSPRHHTGTTVAGIRPRTGRYECRHHSRPTVMAGVNIRSAWTRRLAGGRADHAPRQAGLRMEATPGCPVTN